MEQVMNIELTGLRFSGYHGVYADEKKTGNEFEIDLVVTHPPFQGIIRELEDTINYVSLYALVKKEMETPRALLETLAMEIVEAIQAAFPLVRKVSIRIRKLHAPIAAFEGRVGVHYTRTFDAPR